jgi:hypothetical protein
VREARQANLRGGARDPLSENELVEKYRRNCAHGGWEFSRAEASLAWCRTAFAAPRLECGVLAG